MLGSLLTNNDKLSWQMVLVFIMGSALEFLTMPRVFMQYGSRWMGCLIIQHVAPLLGFKDNDYPRCGVSQIKPLLNIISKLSEVTRDNNNYHRVFWVLICTDCAGFAEKKVFILVETPVEVILSMSVSVHYKTWAQPIARMAELLFPLMVIAILSLLLHFEYWIKHSYHF